MSVRTIVVGADDSPQAAAAIDWVASLASDLGATVTAVHVFEPLDHLGDVRAGTSFSDVAYEMKQNLDDVWAQPLRHAGVEYDTHVGEGKASEVIVGVADDRSADLIVLGARRLGALKAAVLGSTSRNVMALTRIPVTIIAADEG